MNARQTRCGAWSQRRTSVVLAILVLVCYLPGIDWGIPDASSAERVQPWAYDDLAPLAPLTEAYHTFIKGASDRWLVYPLQHHFTLAAAYAPYMAWLWLTGGFSFGQADYPYGFREPVTAFRVLTVVARLITLAMAIGLVLGIYRIGALLWDRQAGVFGALATMLQYPLFYYSKTACLEIPYLFWTAWALVIAARIWVYGVTIRRVVILGVLMACAVATKDQAAGMFVFLPAILGAAYVRDRDRLRCRLWQLGGSFFASAAVAYALGSGLALDPERYLNHLDWVLRRHTTVEWHAWNPPEAYVGPGSTGVARLGRQTAKAAIDVLGPVLAGLSFLGLGIAVRNRERGLWLLAAAAGYWIAFLFPRAHSQGYVFGRYLLPVLVVAALFAGRGLALFVRRTRWRTLHFVAAGLAFFPPAQVSLDLLSHMRHDARYEAEKWLALRLQPGDRIAAAHSLNALPRLPREARVLPIPTGKDALVYLETTSPEFVSVIPDWTSSPGMPYSRAYPRLLFERLADGSLGYTLAASFDCGFWSGPPRLDYPSVSPPVRIYQRIPRSLQE
jgi:hypothetical protein